MVAADAGSLEVSVSQEDLAAAEDSLPDLIAEKGGAQQAAEFLIQPLTFIHNGYRYLVTPGNHGGSFKATIIQD